MYTNKPLVGLKEKVFDTLEEFSSVECEYLIAYIPDIVWGDTLDICYKSCRKTEAPKKEASNRAAYHT